MEFIVDKLALLITSLIATLGYGGVVLAMAIESANIPLPSEIIMPFAGFLVYQGRFNLLIVSLAGSLGCLIGSLFSWWLGKRYGEEVIRYLIRRYGKYLLIFEYELDDAISLFHKYGHPIVFFSRLLPIIRTFISLPAGIAEMDILKFSFYTFVGSFLWSLFLAWVGYRLGANWRSIGVWFHRFDFLILLLLVAGTVFYVYHKLDRYHKYQQRKNG